MQCEVVEMRRIGGRVTAFTLESSEEVARGETERFAGGTGEPLGQFDDRISGSDAERVRGADQEHGVAGDGEGRNAMGRSGRTPLSVAESDELFLVAVV